MDIADEKTPEILTGNAMENFGRIDVLCSFAGIALFSTFEKTTREKYKKTMDTNLNRHFFLAQRVAKEMKKNRLPYANSSRGSIINMCSMTGVHVGEDGVVDYGITKAGLFALTKGLATELGPYNIRANCVSQVYILTPIQIRDYKDVKRRDEVNKRNAIPR